LFDLIGQLISINAYYHHMLFALLFNPEFLSTAYLAVVRLEVVSVKSEMRHYY
jgi:hypothetical protein